MSNFLQIRLVGAHFFPADIQTAMMKLLVAFRNVADAPKAQSINVM